MSSKPTFKYFDIRVEKASVEEDIWEILYVLRPQWTKEELRSEEYTGGYVNSMTCFYQSQDVKREDAVVARVYGLEGVDVPLEREKEFLSIQIANATGCFPPILAAFQNGLVYHFEPGRVVNFHDLTNPRHIKTLAHQLYSFQHADVDALLLFNRRGEPEKYDKTPRGIEMLPFIIKTIPTVPKDASKVAAFQSFRDEMTDEYLLGEYEFVKGILDGAKLHITLSHGDFHPRNIIINDETGKISFIDYEGASFTYECNDLTRLLDARRMYIEMGFCSADVPELTDDIQAMYFREYLNARNKTLNNNATRVTPEEIELLRTQINILDICNNMMFHVFALAYVDLKLKDLSIFDLLPKFRSRYRECRDTLPVLLDQCLELQDQIAAHHAV